MQDENKAALDYAKVRARSYPHREKGMIRILCYKLAESEPEAWYVPHPLTEQAYQAEADFNETKKYAERQKVYVEYDDLFVISQQQQRQ